MPKITKLCLFVKVVQKKTVTLFFSGHGVYYTERERLRDSSVINQHLHRRALGRHGREAADVTEINRHAFVLLGFDCLTMHQLNGHRPDRQHTANVRLIQQLYSRLNN